MKIKHTIFFDVQELYYLPQYLPVFKELKKHHNCAITFIFHQNKFEDIVKNIILKEQLPHQWVDDKNEALQFYLEKKPTWIFLGNTFPELDKFIYIVKLLN